VNGTRLTIRPPADFDLARDACSYGFFLLAPNHWDPETRSLFRVLTLGDGPSTCRITQRDGGGPTTAALTARFDRALTRAEQAEARTQIGRMLGLGTTEAETRAFHRIDTRWKKSGRARLFRSPTLFEDIVKTVTSCNVAWPSTITMNDRLCAVLGGRSASGGHAFPTPATVARTRPATLRSRCRVGYRDQRIVDLAKLYRRGAIDGAWLADPETPDEDAFAFLLTLPGIGPYAAGNIMQLLGRYSRLALDTESVRHGKSVLGYTGTDRQILRLLEAHYEPFGDHRFRSYWFELWDFYERKKGAAHTWDRETTGKTFTAALLKD
jgi:3-methyladenine DNA glycosylase/8-oxoguanine DNA glycosylase